MNITVNADVFNPHFRNLALDNQSFILLLVGGGGSGKSYFAYQRSILKCLRDKRKFLIFRKIGLDVRRSSWNDVKEILAK